jgi:hypothetical protein
MGKYPNSDIHEKYSDFHWGLVELDEKYKRLYVSDIDRLWIEYDFEREEVVGVIDIKYENSGDTITTTEKGIYDWFKKHKVRIFIVYITRDFEKFRVINEYGKELILTKMQYADFLFSLRSKRMFLEFLNTIL